MSESRSARSRKNTRGSVLIIVLWVSFGLVSIALYFANSMGMELRASDNRVARMTAEQAIDGASRYAIYLLANAEEPGRLPDIQSYQRERVPIGDATFWFIGRETLQTGAQTEPFFSLGDEAAKLNLNTATREMLEALPRMTSELAAAIIDWRDADSDVTSGGAENETYLRRNPAYCCKNGRFETVEELRLVLGIEMEILYGEDANRNGVLDPNENDGDVTLPIDNRDGRLDPGLVEYVTVHTRESNTRSDGSPKINVTTAQGRQQLATLLQEKFNADRANEILARLGPAQGTRSVLEFYRRSGMTADEFAQIEAEITASNQAAEGLVNVNSASAAVFACIPGIDAEKAEALVGFRQSNPDRLTSVAWVSEVLDEESITRAGPFLTGRSYQFTADTAAVGQHGRGYRRVRFVLDAAEATPKIISRQDLSDFGWALGRNVTFQLAKVSR